MTFILRILFRYLIITIIGTGLVLVFVFESIFHPSQPVWMVIGSIWTLIFMPWIASPAFEERKQKVMN